MIEGSFGLWKRPQSRQFQDADAGDRVLVHHLRHSDRVDRGGGLHILVKTGRSLGPVPSLATLGSMSMARAVKDYCLNLRARSSGTELSISSPKAILGIAAW